MLAGEGLYGFCVLGLEAPLTIETDVAFVPDIEELEPDIDDIEELEPDIDDIEDIEDIEDIVPLAGCKVNFINPLDACGFLLTWSAITTKSFFGIMT
jgi:hypothetical protein